MAQFTIYRSTDASAPTLSGTAGDLTNLLDKCLADGYGSQSAAGWTKAQTGTNRRAYKGGAGTQLLFRVRDDAGGTGGAKEALLRGFETMSDVNTGTNPFPTSAQSALTDNSLIIRKSATADATTRAWIVVADNKTCYVFIQTGDQANTYFGYGFGDLYSVVAGDVWNAFVQGRAAENSATVGTNPQVNGDFDVMSGAFSSQQVGFFVARNYAGAVGSNQTCKATTWNQNILGLSTGTSSFLAYPNTADSSIYLSRVFVGSLTVGPMILRGYFRGFWGWCHPGGVNDGDTFNGAGDLAGKAFLVIKNSPNQGIFIIETSNTLP